MVPTIIGIIWPWRKILDGVCMRIEDCGFPPITHVLLILVEAFSVQNQYRSVRQKQGGSSDSRDTGIHRTPRVRLGVVEVNSGTLDCTSVSSAHNHDFPGRNQCGSRIGCTMFFYVPRNRPMCILCRRHSLVFRCVLIQSQKSQICVLTSAVKSNLPSPAVYCDRLRKKKGM